MADYLSERPNRRYGWRRDKVRKQGKNFLAIFIVVVLVFASLNGLLKTFSLKQDINKSKWNTSLPFVSVLVTKPVSLFVYNPDDEKITFLKIPDDLYFMSGKNDMPFVKLSDLAAGGDGNEIAKVISINVGKKINSFIVPDNVTTFDKSSAEEFFKSFASIATPVRILTKGPFLMSKTNIERYDAFKLWWQLKGIGIKQVKTVDLDGVTEAILSESGSKVLGVDEESFGFKISQFLKSRVLAASGYKVRIVNAGESADSAALAANFVRNSGMEVVGVEKGDSYENITKIISEDKSGFVPKYLAEIFECDIFSGPKNDQNKTDKSEITVILGNDFSGRYFQ